MDNVLILGIFIMGAVIWSLYAYGKSLDIRANVANPEIGKVIKPVDRQAAKQVIKPVIKPDLTLIIQRIEANNVIDLSEKTAELREKWCARKDARRK